MLNTLMSTCLIAISTGSFPMGWSKETVLKHETAHCVCPDWTHDESASSITPPAQCRGSYHGQKIVIPYKSADIGKICHGHKACVVDIW